MAAADMGSTIGDLAGPDLGAVGNAASVSKQATAQPKGLTSFSVKKGDNGGVIVSETYERKAPEGRRPASFMGGGDYKENPFGPKDGGKAVAHITDLLGQMGVEGAEAPAPEPAAPPLSSPPPRPPVATVARGPAGAAVRGPRGNTAGVFGGPPNGAY